MLVFMSSLLFYASAFATAIGDLEENLKISLDGLPLVRPILIYSDNDKVNIYITGEMIKSATVLHHKTRREDEEAYRKERHLPYQPLPPLVSREQDKLYISGGIYFDFKDEKARGKVIRTIKEMSRIYENNFKLNQETGKALPVPDKDSYFYGSFAARPTWGDRMNIDNLRFLTMRVSILVPIPSKGQSFDFTQSDLNIDRRMYSSGTRLEIWGDKKLFIGIIDTGNTEDAIARDGQILLFPLADIKVMNKLSNGWQTLFQSIIHNIVWQIQKTTGGTLPMRSF